MEKKHYKWSYSIAMLNYRRVNNQNLHLDLVETVAKALTGQRLQIHDNVIESLSRHPRMVTFVIFERKKTCWIWGFYEHVDTLRISLGIS